MELGLTTTPRSGGEHLDEALTAAQARMRSARTYVYYVKPGVLVLVTLLTIFQ